jgi:hypothetical protein
MRFPISPAPPAPLARPAPTCTARTHSLHVALYHPWKGSAPPAATWHQPAPRSVASPLRRARSPRPPPHAAAQTALPPPPARGPPPPPCAALRHTLHMRRPAAGLLQRSGPRPAGPHAGRPPQNWGQAAASQSACGQTCPALRPRGPKTSKRWRRPLITREQGGPPPKYPRRTRSSEDGNKPECTQDAPTVFASLVTPSRAPAMPTGGEKRARRPPGGPYRPNPGVALCAAGPKSAPGCKTQRRPRRGVHLRLSQTRQAKRRAQPPLCPSAGLLLAPGWGRRAVKRARRSLFLLWARPRVGHEAGRLHVPCAARARFLVPCAW